MISISANNHEFYSNKSLIFSEIILENNLIICTSKNMLHRTRNVQDCRIEERCANVPKGHKQVSNI